MTSSNDTPNVPPESEDGKNTETMPVSVRMRRVDAWVVRKAAAQLNQTRSAFMAETSLEKARQVLKKQRATDAAETAA